jgi:hypothetical protein
MFFSRLAARYISQSRDRESGQGRDRTGDTRIFNPWDHGRYSFNISSNRLTLPEILAIIVRESTDVLVLSKIHPKNLSSATSFLPRAGERLVSLDLPPTVVEPIVKLGRVAAQDDFALCVIQDFR